MAMSASEIDQVITLIQREVKASQERDEEILDYLEENVKQANQVNSRFMKVVFFVTLALEIQIVASIWLLTQTIK